MFFYFEKCIVFEKAGLQASMRINEGLSNYLMSMAESTVVPQDVPQGVPQGVPQEVCQSILNIVSGNPKITREEIAKLLGMSSKTVGRYLKKLNDRVRYVGSGHSGHWETFDGNG